MGPTKAGLNSGVVLISSGLYSVHFRLTQQTLSISNTVPNIISIISIRSVFIDNYENEGKRNTSIMNTNISRRHSFHLM